MDRLLSTISAELRPLSGEVFYSGRAAFSGNPDVYILGANPGSDPSAAGLNTVQRNIDLALKSLPERWSSYLDTSWDGRPKGGAPFQLRMKHLATRAKLDLRLTPSSNLVFLRSTRTSELARPWSEMVEVCWPFHALVLSQLKPSVILCLGMKTAQDVLDKLGGGNEIGAFAEANARGWTSRSWQVRSGQRVLGFTHPGIADWTKPATDPSNLLLEALSS